MNDETREQLSAYLDGALPEDARRDLESRLAASAELRGALEDLRAVSRAVKDLPKEPLPPGFLARFQARRARGDVPRRDWVFLPPQARPVVAALSIGVVALALWDKIAPPAADEIHPPEAARVYGSADAPVAQLDLSRGTDAAAKGRLSDAGSLEIAGAARKPEPPDGRLPYLEDGGHAADGAPAAKEAGVAAVRGASVGRAAGRPLVAASGTELTDRTRPAMTEEERSARNEAMFAQLEQQKKRMGIKKVIASGVEGQETGGVGFLAQREPPAAPVVRAPVPALLNAAKPQGSAAESAVAPAPAGPGRLAPDAGLVFSDASSLSSSWVLLGFPGDPPATDFANGRLIVIKPSATKILSVTPGPSAVTVVYRSLLPDEASDPARDRVAPLPASPKDVLIYDASPR